MNEYDEWEKRKNNSSKFQFKIFENAKPWHYVLFIILFVIATQIVKSTQSKFVWIVLGILGALFIISMFKQGEKRKALSRSLAQSIALHDLNSEIKTDGVFPLGTRIIPTGFYKDQVKIEPTVPLLLKYNLGFKITEPDSPPYEICYQMDPFEGRCKGWVEMPQGFTGQDIKDIDLVFPDKIIKEDRKNENFK